MWMLALALAGSNAVDVRFAAGVIASAFAARQNVDVLTADDLRQAVNVEAESKPSGVRRRKAASRKSRRP